MDDTDKEFFSSDCIVLTTNFGLVSIASGMGFVFTTEFVCFIAWMTGLTVLVCSITVAIASSAAAKPKL